jgi:hypothetical protein
MMLRCALITSVVLLANVARSQAEPPLKPGDQVILECLSGKVGNRFLDGRTGDGTVGLAAKTGRRFTGTKWKLHDCGKGKIQLECLGAAKGPRWLDGVTGDATVQLTDDNKLSWDEFIDVWWQRGEGLVCSLRS